MRNAQQRTQRGVKGMEDINDVKLESLDEKTRLYGRYYSQLMLTRSTGEVDQDAIIRLVDAARGTRSIRQFAEELNVNPSSISRILNGKVKEINNQLLAKIAVYADPDSGVTIEKLMEAQGKVKAEEIDVLYTRFESACRRTISDELLQRGYSVSYVKDLDTDTKRVCDFAIKTDALSNNEDVWLFECKMLSAQSQYPVGIGRTRIWIDSAMAYYYKGKTAGRLTLVVDRKEVFENVKETLKEYLLNDEISVMYISPNQGKVMEEYIAPLADARTPITVFMGE